MNRLISVIIPTYHSRGGLGRAIDSVLSQNNVDVEVIVVDDNDPKSIERISTEKEMAKYSDNSKVVYIRHEFNKNGAAARNTGIKASKGSYIAFLDDDDYFLPEKLNRQIEFLEQHTEHNGVYGQILRSGRVVAVNLSEGNLSKDLLMLRAHMQTSTLMFRTEVIKQIGGFDECFFRHQDYELLLKYFRGGNTIGAIHVPVSEFGRNEGENIPYGSKLEDIKNLFLSKFETYIDSIDASEPGFKSKVYAIHYGGVFASHLKHAKFANAIKLFFKYGLKAPVYFFRPLFRSINLHLTGKA